MVSMNPNPSQGYYSFDSMNLNHHLPIVESLPRPQSAISSSDCATTASFLEDSNKKIRKPYTITNSRENWTEQEHDKFLEALQLFDRDWKKIEAFVGSKTVIQIRSHAQKYFLKIQKSGKREHVPPPRPKKKASHPYPQKAPKNTTSQNPVLYQPLSSTFETRCIDVPESSAAFRHPESSTTLSSWSSSSVPMVNGSQVPTDGVKFTGSTTARNYSYSSNNVSTPQTRQTGEISRADQSNIFGVMPDFAQVYSFIGSVFDPSVSDHLQRLRQMDPINLETALLLMQNLAINLTSPEFENHRRLLSLYDEDLKKAKYGGGFGNNICCVRSENTILSA